MASYKFGHVIIFSLILVALLLLPHECYADESSMRGRKEMGPQMEETKININLCVHYKKCGDHRDCYCCIPDDTCWANEDDCVWHCHNNEYPRAAI
ncbi:hypothetical protein CASFOL_029063 [Castilleja foliolosa]|uniref:Uncharacterized protein n=1 Tax=Castilleja foliolosa TaxID=1961234 RepID=A0ABD3CG04_9LAMI